MTSPDHTPNDRADTAGSAAMLNARGAAPILLICEHASRKIPPEYEGLGLSPEAQISHVAWDPGALDMATHMGKLLDARLIVSTVSRLVYDCNRPPEAPGAMPEKSEIFDIPGNANLSPAQRDDRTARFYRPFQTLLNQTIKQADIPPILVTLHSFTPVYQGVRRDVEIGILHDTDSRLADEMLAHVANHTTHIVERNAPYGPQDGVTHTLKEHGISNGLLNVMIEIRNDLIATPAAQRAMAEILANLITDALRSLPTEQ